MNLTVQQYLTGLERTVKNLPGVLHRWHDLAGDLREHFLDELLWMSDVHGQVVEKARSEGKIEIVVRLCRAGLQLDELRAEIERRTGAEITPYKNLYGASSLFCIFEEPAEVKSASSLVERKPANDDGYAFDLDIPHAYAA